jgi:hydroxypyruvate reductase
MTRGALDRLGDRFAGGVVVHPLGASIGGGWPRTLRFLPGGHPIPTRESLRAGRAVAALAGRAKAGDLVIVLLSGGGSAMAELPKAGLRLSDLQRVTRDLQRGGADIAALNTVRRALSQLKGGGIARRVGAAALLALALSDVVGDSPEAIASGPTVPSPTGARDAVVVLRRFGLAGNHARILKALRGSEGPRVGTGSRPGRRAYAIVGSNGRSALAAAAAARALGFTTRRSSAPVTGEARVAGARMAEAVKRLRRDARRGALPACLIYGGETTVTVRGSGRGGRNLEIVLGAAEVLDGLPRVALLSFATDGWDGSSRAAGAFATGRTWAEAARRGHSPVRALARNDTAPLFRALGDLLVTGRSGTNVNDITIAVIYPAAKRPPTRPRPRRSPRRTPRARSRS